jgi:hypothetical protein
MTRQVAAALSVFVLLANTAAAQDLPPPDPRMVINFLTENDAYGTTTDRFYTNGVRFGWSSAEESLPEPLAALDRGLARLFGSARSRWGIGIGQSMYTPVDKVRHNPDPRDRPYAGHLYAELSLDRRTHVTLDRYSLQIGVIGPVTLARLAQDVAHQIHGERPARGWSYQLHNEPVFNLAWDRTWRAPLATLPGWFDVDVLPTLTLAAGTVQTYAALGGRLRIGQGLGRDFGTPRIRPAIADTPAPVGEGFGWYLFAGAAGRLVAHDIFLNGNTFRDSRSVDHRPLVADLEFGAAVFWQNIRLSYTQVFRSKEFVAQGRDFSFGALSLSFAF